MSAVAQLNEASGSASVANSSAEDERSSEGNAHTSPQCLSDSLGRELADATLENPTEASTAVAALENSTEASTVSGVESGASQDASKVEDTDILAHVVGAVCKEDIAGDGPAELPVTKIADRALANLDGQVSNEATVEPVAASTTRGEESRDETDVNLTEASLLQASEEASTELKSSTLPQMECNAEVAMTSADTSGACASVPANVPISEVVNLAADVCQPAPATPSKSRVRSQTPETPPNRGAQARNAKQRSRTPEKKTPKRARKEGPGSAKKEASGAKKRKAKDACAESSGIKPARRTVFTMLVGRTFRKQDSMELDMNELLKGIAAELKSGEEPFAEAEIQSGLSFLEASNKIVRSGSSITLSM